MINGEPCVARRAARHLRRVGRSLAFSWFSPYARFRGRAADGGEARFKENNMALLIVELDKRIGNAEAWRDAFAEQLPDLEVRI